MNQRIIPTIVIAGLLAAGVFVAAKTPYQAQSRSETPKLLKQSSQTAVPPIDPGPSPWSRLKNSLDELVSKGETERAFGIIQTNLDQPYRAQLREYQANLLAHTGNYSDALNVFMGLLNGDYGMWEPSSRKLTVPLNLGVAMGKQAEVDRIASWIVSHPEWDYSSNETLAIPKSGKTPALRLAYAYVTLAHNADWDSDVQTRVQYLEKASDLAPSDARVSFQLADAYRNRHKVGDLTRSKALLLRAYRAVPAGTAARRDVRIQAALYGVDVAGPDAKTSIQADLRASMLERRAKQQAEEAKSSANTRLSGRG